MRSATRRAAIVVVAVTMAAACAGDDKSAASSTTSGPTAATAPASTAAPTTTVPPNFYEPPNPLPAGQPGDIIRSRALTPPASVPAGTKVFRILYLSTNTKGTPIAVSGLIYIPATAPVDGKPRDILSVAHGTVGLGDQCAPSAVAAGEGKQVSEVAPFIGGFLPQYTVVESDYEGLGTPGVHPFVMGISEAHGVLDAIRAAQRFEGAGTSAQSRSVVWGHSQGGGAALVTAELATRYAPDANVVGVVAGSPAAELKLFEPVLKNGPSKGYIMMAAAGLKAAYPELDLSGLFTPAGLEGVQMATTSCFETNEKYKTVDGSTLFTADPGTVEPFATLLTENSPAFRKSDVPILIYHGEADQLIPVSLSKIVFDKYCKLGTVISRQTYPGASHTGVIPLAMTNIQQYLADRLSGKPAPNQCSQPVLLNRDG